MAAKLKELFLKRLAIVSFIFFVFFSPQITSAQQSVYCPIHKVSIRCKNAVVTELALNAIRKTYQFFRNLGYAQTYFLEIVFQKKVFVETRSGHFIRVFGKVGKHNRIYITDWDEPWLKERNAYGLEMSRALYESLIVHEAAHLIAEKIAGGNIGCKLSEYIAYVVQLSQMPSQMRQDLLNRCGQSAFKAEEIHLDIMLIDPVVFAIKSYLHFKENQGRLLKKILSGAILMGPTSATP